MIRNNHGVRQKRGMLIEPYLQTSNKKVNQTNNLQNHVKSLNWYLEEEKPLICNFETVRNHKEIANYVRVLASERGKGTDLR